MSCARVSGAGTALAKYRKIAWMLFAVSTAKVLTALAATLLRLA